MHELSLTENIVKILTQESKQQGFTRVKRVVLSIGALSGVEPESIAFCFDVVAEGTVAAKAKLEYVVDPAHGKCRDCGTEALIPKLPAECPKCQGYALEISGGNEMIITELEVE
jgi:hydrogenase nickel incorporation protein HypA/HybF